MEKTSNGFNSRSSTSSDSSADNKHADVVHGFVLEQLIGRGSYAQVKLAVNPQTKDLAAIKILSKDAGKDIKQIQREVKVQSTLSHPNIIQLRNAFEGDHFIYLLLEYAAYGELFDKIVPDVGVDEVVAHFFFKQLINAVEYLHNQGICHRDLKPENLLLDHLGNLKISDFGLATFFHNQGTKRLLNTFCGSPPYIAPEIIYGQYQAEPVDIWSCGVILFVLLMGNTPWDEPTPASSEFDAFSKGELDEQWNSFPPEIKSLLLGILAIDPAKRFTIKDIKQHPWVQRENPFYGPDGLCQDPSALLVRLKSKWTESSVESLIDPTPCLSQPNVIFCDSQESIDFASSEASSQSSLSSSSQPSATFDDLTSSREFDYSLTRFRASLSPISCSQKILRALEFLGISFRSSNYKKISISTIDLRKCSLRGEIKVFPWETDKSFVVLNRTRGDPLEFKRLFTRLVTYIRDIVYR